MLLLPTTTFVPRVLSSSQVHIFLPSSVVCPSSMTVAQELRLVLSSFARFGGVAFCLLQVAEPIKCVGPSMLPILNRDGDIVLLDKLTPLLWKLELGDVVVAKFVLNPRQTVCKQIIAQEGDTVSAPRSTSSELEFLEV